MWVSFQSCIGNLRLSLVRIIFKVFSERRQGLEDPVQELGLGSVVIPPNAKYLFGVSGFILVTIGA